MSEAIIKFEHVSVRKNGRTVLQNITFCLPKGGHLAITGESGCGKTTLSNLIMGQEGRPEMGYVQFGKDADTLKKSCVSHSQDRKALHIGKESYYQQRYNSVRDEAIDVRTVESTLAETTSAYPEPEEKERKNRYLKHLGLSHKTRTPISMLSNGEQRKWQLIKALLTKPDMLILDNAFSGLDPESRSRLSDLLDEAGEEGITLIICAWPKQWPSCITHVLELGANGHMLSFSSKSNYLNHHPLTKPEKQAAAIRITELPFKLPAFENRTEEILSMKNIHVRYGDTTILRDVTWHVKRGEKWILSGENGSGKSTLISLITGDNPQAYSNDIHIFGHRRGKPGFSIWDLKKRIGYLSPELDRYFDKHISLSDAVASGFTESFLPIGKRSREEQEKMDAWIAFMGLTEKKDLPLYRLSAGEQRWTLLIRALVKDPELLILDEPCGELDEEHADKLKAIITTLCKGTDLTMIYITHYEEEIPQDCITGTLSLNEGVGKIHSRQSADALLTY